jgi:N-acetyl-alpha-D-muramate 1-phosphate uridylyltransferase
MILAAGVGERMRPLTDLRPKPLLEVGGKPLIHWLIERLVAAGWTELVINHAHLGMQIEHYLQDGRALGASIAYSRESSPLETAGGIATALPLLGEGPFMTVNGDLFCDYPFAALRDLAPTLRAQGLLGHLVLVDNPPHHPKGDFALIAGRISATEVPRYTFSGIGLYDSMLFAATRQHERAKLAPLLVEAAATRRLSGEIFRGEWRDIGTPDRLAELDRMLRNSDSKTR